MTGRIEKVLVIWADAAGRRHVIGDLWREGEGFAFAYQKDGIERAKREGFHLLAEFPHDHGSELPYHSPTLFPTFKQRIPHRTRSDYDEMLRGWGVRTEDPLEILVKSGGILHTDTLEFAEFRPADDDLSQPLSFRLSGKRFTKEGKEPEPGQPLLLEREPENTRDPEATIVLTLQGHQIGWVPVHYSRMISRLLDEGVPLQATIERRLLLPNERGRWVVRVERSGKEEPAPLRVAEPSPGGWSRSHQNSKDR